MSHMPAILSAPYHPLTCPLPRPSFSTQVDAARVLKGRHLSVYDERTKTWEHIEVPSHASPPLMPHLPLPHSSSNALSSPLSPHR